jgi:predicted dehydrogenase
MATFHLKEYQAHNAEVIAFADVNRGAAEGIAHGIKNATCFDNYKDLINSELVNAVSICTPPRYHEEAAIFALQHNVHVLCEKPLAHSVESARLIMKAAKRSEALMMTAFRHRFLPAIQKIREIISKGTIGPIVFFQNTFCGPSFKMKDKWFSKKVLAGGGTIMDTSSHSVDLFRYLIGEVIEQKAVMHRHLEGTDVEDTSILILKAENGAIGSLTASWVAGDGIAFIDITGQNGRVIYDYSKAAEVRLKKRGEKEWETISVKSSNGFAEEIGHFLAAIRGKEPVSCTVRDGLRALEIIQINY